MSFDRPASELKPSLAAKLVRLSPLAVAAAFVLLVLFVLSFNVESSGDTTTDSLQVAINASPANPIPGQTVTLSASISNPPSGYSPSYKWEMNLGGWDSFGTGTTFKYRAYGSETWDFRVTVSYGNGDSATDSITVSWISLLTTPSVTPGDTALLLSWTAPSEGSSLVTGYEVQHKQTSQSSWPSTSQASAVTSAEVSNLTNGTSYDVRVRACNSANACGGWSPSASGTPQPAPTASPANPFLGQQVTLTAPLMSTQAATSYQWQSWSGSAWTDQGSASTSSTLELSSPDSAGVLAYRVAVTYGTGAEATTATSSAVVVEWKPVVISLTSSPEFPLSGQADKRTVTLTAGGDVPSGATYQWQEWSGIAWTNLGTASTAATKTVSSTSRGTKKYQVVVGHTSASSVTSEPIHVTWDEWAIVGDLSSALASAVEGHTDYTTAQATLLTCMNSPSSGDGAIGTAATSPQLESFTDILSQYSGDIKAKMDGTCGTQSTSMFTTVQTLTATQLGSYGTSTSTGFNAEYAAWLATPRGQQYTATAGDPAITKHHAFFMSSDTVISPGRLEPPYYTGADGDGAVGAASLAQTPGLGCLPNEVRGQFLTPANKLRVLNCLIFATPHEFWVADEDGNRTADKLRYGPEAGRWGWLGTGDWVCTDPAFEGPVPSCLKHDVGYASLQMFAGASPGAADGDELDAMWNPRNKALADAKFRKDIEGYGCQNISGDFAQTFCAVTPNRILASTFFWGVAHVNHKGWPVTDQDRAHFEATRQFVVCGGPPTPTLSVDSVSVARRGTDLAFDAQLTATDGCVDAISIESYTVIWKVTFDNDQGYEFPEIGRDYASETPRSTFELDTTDTRVRYLEVSSVEIARIEIRPNHIEYGGDFYTIPVNRRVYSIAPNPTPTPTCDASGDSGPPFNPCLTPTPTPTPTPVPPTPTDTPTPVPPIPTPECDASGDSAIIPDPCKTPTPTPTPECDASGDSAIIPDPCKTPTPTPTPRPQTPPPSYNPPPPPPTATPTPVVIPIPPAPTPTPTIPGAPPTPTPWPDDGCGGADPDSGPSGQSDCDPTPTPRPCRNCGGDPGD